MDPDTVSKAAETFLDAAGAAVGKEAWREMRNRVANMWRRRGDDDIADQITRDAEATHERLSDPAAGQPDHQQELMRWVARFGALAERHADAIADLQRLADDQARTERGGTTHQSANSSGWFNKQIQMGPHSSYKAAALGAGGAAVLALIAVLVTWLVIKPDLHSDDPTDPVSGSAPSAAAAGTPRTSCGPGLPSKGRPADGADDRRVLESLSYRVSSASSNGHDITSGGYVDQAFVAGRKYLSQATAIIGSTNTQRHSIRFQILRTDGTELARADVYETADNNNKDIIADFAQPAIVSPGDVLLLRVTNRSTETLRFYVDPAVTSPTPSPFPACIVGEKQMPSRHPDLHSLILSGSVTARDIR